MIGCHLIFGIKTSNVTENSIAYIWSYGVIIVELDLCLFFSTEAWEGYNCIS